MKISNSNSCEIMQYETTKSISAIVHYLDLMAML